MIFLEESDLFPQIEPHVLDAVTSEDPALIDQMELAGIAEMQSYLRNRYDVAVIFAPKPADPEPDTRNRLVMMYLTDIVIYHLYARVIPRQIPEIRGIRYENAINWLKSISKGMITPELPVLPTDQRNSPFRWGSSPLKSR